MPISRTTLHKILPYAIAITVMVVLGLTPIIKALGAHPWWATLVVWRGLPAGLIIGFALPFVGLAKPYRIVVLVAVLLITAVISSHYHTRFVAAEDADAYWPGRFWFYAWITMMATLPALLVTVFQKK